MKKLLTFVIILVGFVLTACTPVEVTCGEGTVEVNGVCQAPATSCEDGFTLVDGICEEDEEVTCEVGYHEENGECVVDTLTCEVGYHEENGECVEDPLVCNTGYHEEDGECVENEPVVLPDWFDDWAILNEPIGDKGLNDYTFTETGFSIFLEAGNRTGIQMKDVVLEPDFYYEVAFDYQTSEPGVGLFVQLQGHGGYEFTIPNIVTSGESQSFSHILALPPDYFGTTGGWLTIEFTPSSVSATITVDNIQLIKTALPECGENEEIDGLECVPTNNGFLPNGTPTAWFDGWGILQIPSGDKEISDLEFTETGYTVYLGEGNRSGIELLGYVFESGYTYELTFDYTASVAGRLVWVQMEALGGYGFTNTDTWTIAGTATFTQTLVIPTSYTPVEPGWIKLELAPGAQDNITIDNITIIKTPIE